MLLKPQSTLLSIGPPKVTSKRLKIKDNVDPVGLSLLSDLSNLKLLFTDQDQVTIPNKIQLTVQEATEITDVTEDLWITLLLILKIMVSPLKMLIHTPLEMEPVKKTEPLLLPQPDSKMLNKEIVPVQLLLSNNNPSPLPSMPNHGNSIQEVSSPTVEKNQTTESYQSELM